MLKFLLPIVAYFIGSISSAIVISKLKGLEDPRKVGSGNPGATNVLRSGDKTAAALTLVGDVFKGFLPVMIAKIMGGGPILIALVGLAAFLGHVFPYYYNYKGGKGVATAAGVFLAIDSLVAFFLVCIWLAVVLVTQYSSLAALVAAIAAPLLLLLLAPSMPNILLAAVIAGFLVWRHHENIERLLAGTESKIDISKQL